MLSLRLDFVAKMVSSHDATSPCDLLQGLVAGTSPIVCADLKIFLTQVWDKEKETPSPSKVLNRRPSELSYSELSQ